MAEEAALTKLTKLDSRTLLDLRSSASESSLLVRLIRRAGLSPWLSRLPSELEDLCGDSLAFGWGSDIASGGA